MSAQKQPTNVIIYIYTYIHTYIKRTTQQKPKVRINQKFRPIWQTHFTRIPNRSPLQCHHVDRIEIPFCYLLCDEKLWFRCYPDIQIIKWAFRTYWMLTFDRGIHNRSPFKWHRADRIEIIFCSVLCDENLPFRCYSNAQIKKWAFWAYWMLTFDSGIHNRSPFKRHHADRIEILICYLLCDGCIWFQRYPDT
jgi:hypothetical protein